MVATLREWFCLKADRQNFKPNVRKDRGLIFCHTDEIEERAQMSIERSFSTGEPVKMMIYGNWGVGKTHAVRHICWWLEQHSDFSVKSVIVEVGDLNRKSLFGVLVRPFLDEVGISKIVNLVNEYSLKKGKNVREGLKDIGVGNDVIEDYANFMMTPPGSSPVPATEQAFEHLKGGTVRTITPNTIEQSRAFYDVLAALGHLFQAVEGKDLILIADEAARLDEVESDDATRSHWDAVNRMIFDDANGHFGFIYTLGASNEREIPRVLSHAQTANRMGKQNMIKLDNLSDVQVRSFLESLLASFVDRDGVEALVASGDIDKGVDKNIFPFEAAAFDRFVDFWKRDPENSKPRDITDKLTDAAFIAMKVNKRLIDEGVLELARM
jgi:hypothetical protein